MAKDSPAFCARYTLSDIAAVKMVADLLASTASDPVTHGLAVAVVGCYGELVAFGAHHSCPPLPRLLAQRKAYTALMLRRSTRQVSEEVRCGALTLGLLNDVMLLPMPGGMPIRQQGTVVGAIGISGLPVEQDIALAESWAQRFG